MKLRFLTLTGYIFLAAFIFAGCKVKIGDDLSDPSSVSSAIDSLFINPTSLSLTSPSSGTTSADPTPIFNGTASESGRVSVYLNSSCSTQFGSSTSISSGASFSVTDTVTVDGLKTFYYRFTDSASNSSGCVASGLSFTYQASPIIYFSRDGYNIGEDSVTIGSAVTISRDVSGIASSVTLAYSNFIATSGSDFTGNSTTVNFAVDDLSVSVSPAIFTIVDDSTIEGDEGISLRMVVVSGGTADASRNYSMASIVDNDLAGDYFFSASFYSVSENGTNASLYVQRQSSVSAASVDVAFDSASATGGTDYTSTTQTVNFAIGVDEVLVSVPIIDNSTQADSHSFFAKLVSPSTGTSVRAQSRAKVRIVDDDDTTACDSSNSNVAVNSGFGAGAGTGGDPYLVCSLFHFYNIRNHLTSYFKIMADLDLMNTQDADPNTVGTQALTPITGVFKASIEGNEKTLKNFRYTGTGALDLTAGMIRTALPTVDTSYLQNINILGAMVTNVGAKSGVLVGTAGSGTSYIPTFSDNFIQAKLANVSGSYTGMAAAYVTASVAASQNVTFRRTMTAGYVTGASHYVGGVFGDVNGSSATPDFTFASLYNTANIIPSAAVQSVGGVMGSLTAANVAGSALTISGSDNRGFILSSGANMGGIVGYSATTHTLTLSDNTNYGTISSDANYAGGILGMWRLTAGTSVHTASTNANYGNLIYPVAGTSSAYGGGIVGAIATNEASAQAITLNSNTNSGSVSLYSQGFGGIVGYATIGHNSGSITISNNTNTGTVTSASTLGKLGGILGYYYCNGAVSSSSNVVSGNTNSGVIGAASESTSGGIIGLASASCSGTANTISISTNTNSANVSGAGFTGGIVGYFTGTDNGNANGQTINVTSNANSSTGAVTSTGSYIGGQVGYMTVRNNMTYNFTNGSNAGAVTGGDQIGGFIGSVSGAMAGTNVGGITLQNATNTGSVTSTGNYVGGLIGQISIGDLYTYQVTGSHNTGTILALSTSGGLIGNIVSNWTGTLTLEKSYNAGNVSASSTRVGGLVGSANQTQTLNILNSYTDNVSVFGGSGQVGGILGLTNTSIVTGNITNCYSLANLSTTSGTMGGIFGGMQNGGSVVTVTDSYWRKDGTYNTAVGNDGNQKTDAELQNAATFGTWSISNLGGAIWWDPGTNPIFATLYPTLQ